MSVPSIFGGFGWSIKAQKPGAFWEGYKLETKGGSRANLLAVEALAWVRRAMLGSLDQEPCSRRQGRRGPNGALAAPRVVG